MGAFGAITAMRNTTRLAAAQRKPEPTVPEMPNAAEDEKEARRRALRSAAILRQRAQGATSRSDTLLTGARGLSSPAPTAQKTLLGY